jgi:hypothetical protein
MSKYMVLIKHLNTDLVVEGPFFKRRKDAKVWMEAQMMIWEDERAFKIVKV